MDGTKKETHSTARLTFPLAAPLRVTKAGVRRAPVILSERSESKDLILNVECKILDGIYLSCKGSSLFCSRPLSSAGRKGAAVSLQAATAGRLLFAGGRPWRGRLFARAVVLFPERCGGGPLSVSAKNSEYSRKIDTKRQKMRYNSGGTFARDSPRRTGEQDICS